MVPVTEMVASVEEESRRAAQESLLGDNQCEGPGDV